MAQDPAAAFQPAVAPWKYQGTGNDFIILDERSRGVKAEPPPATWVARACDRHFGVGADGVLTVLPPAQPGHRARMHITNADGSVPEMCGNGLRCVALFLEDSDGRRGEFVVDTDAGPRGCEVTGNPGRGSVRLSMGKVLLGAAAGLPAATQARVGGADVRSLAVSVGNPHLVLDMAAPARAEAERLGPGLVHSAGFPHGCNVEWLERAGEGLRVLVYERGVGLTLACGTGAVASAFAAETWGWVSLDRGPVAVELPGGVVRVGRAPGGEATLEGPAERVFRAELG